MRKSTKISFAFYPYVVENTFTVLPRLLNPNEVF